MTLPQSLEGTLLFEERGCLESLRKLRIKVTSKLEMRLHVVFNPNINLIHGLAHIYLLR